MSGMDVPENSNKGCVGTTSGMAGKAEGCAGCPNQKACASGDARRPDPALNVVKQKMSSISHTLLVLSGKGGVGKSSTACQLAFALAGQGKQVGLLDIDICGPSVPRMLGLTGETVHHSGSGWSPVYVQDNLGVMSIGFMLPNQDDAVIWRGPKKNGLIKQFLTDVDWGQLDYLIVDTPPGTSDEHISIVQYLKGTPIDGAVVVTTPQEVAMMDVRKELNFCKKTGLNIIGIVENMSGLQVPMSSLSCRTKTGEDKTAELVKLLQDHAPHLLDTIACADVFPAFGSGPEGMAAEFECPLLGRIPLDPNFLKACDSGESFLEKYANSPAAPAFGQIVNTLVQRTSK